MQHSTFCSRYFLLPSDGSALIMKKSLDRLRLHLLALGKYALAFSIVQFSLYLSFHICSLADL